MMGVFVDSGCDVLSIITVVCQMATPELAMDDVCDLFQTHGHIMKVIFDISLPGRAWIVFS